MRDSELLTSPRIRLAFWQTDLDVEGSRIELSPWGAVSLHYVPSARISYLNLNVEGTWQIRNVPLITVPQARRRVAEQFDFGLGVEPGVRVVRLRYGYSVGLNVVQAIPALHALARVRPAVQRLYSDFSDGHMSVGQPAERLGGAIKVFGCRVDYPNQPCAKNECCPAAVSNSLQWLKKQYHLNVPDDELTIAKWKDILQWQPDGTTHGAWADKKAAYFVQHHLPFTSQKFNKAQAAQVLQKFDAGCAVELDLGDHVVSVTCMGVNADGSYSLRVASDLKQNGDPTGPTVETLKLDPTGTCTDGPKWAKGKEVQNFVVECRQ